MVLRLSKKVHFLQIYAEFSKKYVISIKSIKLIYICAFERLRYVLSENGIFHYAITYCFGDISF